MGDGLPIVCFPMFNSYGLMDNILTGDGDSSRSFRTTSELRLALQRAGIRVEIFNEDIEGLECGLSFEIAASQSQKGHLFANKETDEAPLPILVQ
jgi:hypothetical protein